MVHPELHPPACARRHAARCDARRRQSIPEQPAGGTPTDTDYRSCRTLERARRRSRHAGPAETGDRAVTPLTDPAIAAPGADRHQLKRIQRGLKLLTVPLPYLAGLAAKVRVTLDDRVPT